MAKRNLLSKLIAGVLAAGMVVTMLPGMSLRSEAAGTIRFYQKANTVMAQDGATEIERAALYVYDESKLATPWALTKLTDTAPGATYNTNSKDAKFVLVPGDYYEYRTTTKPTVTALPGTSSATPTAPGYVWDSDQPGGNGQKIEKNTKDPSGRSYIITFPKELFANSSPAGTGIQLIVPEPQLLEVEIEVRTDGTVRASQESILPKQEMGDFSKDGGKVWKVSFDPTLLIAATGKLGKYLIDGEEWITAPGDEHGDNTSWINVGANYASEIMIYANNGASGRSFPMEVFNGYRTDTESFDSYKDNDLVDVLLAADLQTDFSLLTGESKARAGFDWDGAANDITGYVNIFRVDDQWADSTTNIFDKDEDGTLDTSMSTLNGADAQEVKEPMYEEFKRNVHFSINPEDIYRLYVFGPAAGNDIPYAEKSVGELITPAGTDGSTLRKQAQSLRYGPYQKVVISLGNAAPRDAEIKIQNGDQITDNISVANVYKYEYVIRDKDGNRFDAQSGSIKSYESLSAEPVEYPLSNTYWYQANEKYMTGYKEGQVFEFQVRLDKNFTAGDNFIIQAYGHDNLSGTDGTGSGVVIEDVEYELAEGTDNVYNCKFTIGMNSPYRIVARGVVQKTQIKVKNIPEDDAIFHGDHKENVLPLTNEFYGYVPFLGATDGKNETNDGQSCNVANPRYQIFIDANEEDDALIDLVAFSRPGAVGTGVDWIAHSFPVGTQKFKIRFNDEFVNQGTDILNDYDNDAAYMHGTFDADRTDDRYGKGPDFKVLVNGTAVTVADDDTFTVDMKEDTTIKVEGVVRKYYVYMPLLNGYDVELDSTIEAQREEYVRFSNYGREQADSENAYAYDFRSAIIEGGTYKFKLNSDDKTSTPVVKAGTTTLTADADGWYSFVVRNDTWLTVDGMNVDGFNDVANRSTEEQDAINWLKDKGVINGYDDGSFRPGNSTTRAEFVKMLFELKKGTAGTASFSDTSGHWAAGQIGWGSAQSIVNGYPDGTFKPNQAISRAEVAQVIWKLAGSQGSSFKANFPDVSQTAWYSPALNWNFERGIIKGYENGNFGPSDPIERAHMALILYRSQGEF